MTNEMKEVIYAHPTTYAFFKAAIVAGAHNELNTRPCAQGTAARNRNLLGIYYFTDASIRDLSGIYGVSPERISQLIERELGFFWRLSPPDVQRQFPLSEIPFEKPRSTYWEKMSRRNKGISAAILPYLQAGVSPEEIAEALGLSSRQLNESREVLARHGHILPFIRTHSSQNRELVRALREPQGDDEIQRLLNQVKRKFYSENVGSVLASVSSVVRLCGLRSAPTKLAPYIQAISDAQIPLGKLEEIFCSNGSPIARRHYFIASQHKTRVQEALSRTTTSP